MRHQSKLVLVGLTAAFLLAIAISSASANRLSLSNRAIRATWQILEFSEPEGAFSAVRCPVTIEGSFHSNTIRKVVGSLIGYITRAAVNSGACTNGRATVLLESLPWHVRYRGFSGILPNIELLQLGLIRAAFRINVRILFEFFCLATTTTANPAVGNANLGAGGVVNTIDADPSAQIPTVGAGGSGCPASFGVFSNPAGDGRVTLLGNTTRITVTLI
jgi:hypothetical protein